MKRKVKIKAWCRLTVYAELDKNKKIVEITDIEEIDEILGDEEIIDIIY